MRWRFCTYCRVSTACRSSLVGARGLATAAAMASAGNHYLCNVPLHCALALNCLTRATSLSQAFRTLVVIILDEIILMFIRILLQISGRVLRGVIPWRYKAPRASGVCQDSSKGGAVETGCSTPPCNEDPVWAREPLPIADLPVAGRRPARGSRHLHPACEENIYIYIYIYIHTYMYIYICMIHKYIYIYIYIERERDDL